jgi:hypothetical protein
MHFLLRRRRHSLLSLVGAVLLPILSACGAARPSTGAAPNPAVNNAIFAGAVLRHMPIGIAVLSWTPQDQTLTVKISMQGLVPGTAHPAHIHRGSCQHAGPVLYALPLLKADAHGNASITATFRGVAQGIPVSGWYVNVHNGPTALGAMQVLSIACGDISNPTPSVKIRQQVTVLLGDDPSPNQAVRGQAQLRLSGKTLTIHVSISGLVPDSLHDFHIHAGSCINMGRMLYAAQTLKANARGEADATTTISGVSAIPRNGWYLVVYLSSEAPTEANSDVIACGDVVPSVA